MFPRRYFSGRGFTPRYFPVGADNVGTDGNGWVASIRGNEWIASRRLDFLPNRKLNEYAAERRKSGWEVETS